MVKRISNQPWLLNVNSSLVILVTGEYVCIEYFHVELITKKCQREVPAEQISYVQYIIVLTCISTCILHVQLLSLLVVHRMRFASDNA